VIEAAAAARDRGAQDEGDVVGRVGADAPPIVVVVDGRMRRTSLGHRSMSTSPVTPSICVPRRRAATVIEAGAVRRRGPPQW
jgi:hypothetical protein